MEDHQTVLFLCSGNYYRSRFAEALFNHLAVQSNLTWRAESRGIKLNPTNKGSISEFTIIALHDRKVPLPEPNRFPIVLEEDDLKQSDHIVAVKRDEHEAMMEERFPEWLECVEFWAIDDIDCSSPTDAIPALEVEVLRLLDRLGSGPP